MNELYYSKENNCFVLQVVDKPQSVSVDGKAQDGFVIFISPNCFAEFDPPVKFVWKMQSTKNGRAADWSTFADFPADALSASHMLRGYVKEFVWYPSENTHVPLFAPGRQVNGWAPRFNIAQTGCEVVNFYAHVTCAVEDVDGRQVLGLLAEDILDELINKDFVTRDIDIDMVRMFHMPHVRYTRYEIGNYTFTKPVWWRVFELDNVKVYVFAPLDDCVMFRDGAAHLISAGKMVIALWN